MQIKEIMEKISKINNSIDKSHPERTKIEKSILKGFKITEEVGELYNEMFLSLNFARKEKGTFSKDNLGEEFADVILSTLVAAFDMGIDIEEELEKKLEIVFNRFGLN